MAVAVAVVVEDEEEVLSEPERYTGSSPCDLAHVTLTESP